jgi:hypothetical protein
MTMRNEAEEFDSLGKPDTDRLVGRFRIASLETGPAVTKNAPL